jgi:hypothetical protein
MIKKFYVLAWLMLAGSVLATLFSGSVSDLDLLAFGLITLGLVYSLVFWSVYSNNNKEPQPE